MGRRVVVTGMGILSPTGNTVNEAWNNVKNGINGIGPLTKAGAEDLPVHFAGELKNLDPLDFLDKKEVRRYDEYAQYGVIAGSQAMADAGLEQGKSSRAIRSGLACLWGAVSAALTQWKKKLPSSTKRALSGLTRF